MAPTKKDDLSLFVDRLIAEKGLSNLDPEVLAQMKTDLLDRVENRINALIVSKLPPDKLTEFEMLVDGGSTASIQKYCQKHVPNLDEAVAGELLSFRQTYLGV